MQTIFVEINVIYTHLLSLSIVIYSSFSVNGMFNLIYLKELFEVYQHYIYIYILNLDEKYIISTIFL